MVFRFYKLAQFLQEPGIVGSVMIIRWYVEEGELDPLIGQKAEQFLHGDPLIVIEAAGWALVDTQDAQHCIVIAEVFFHDLDGSMDTCRELSISTAMTLTMKTMLTC